MTTTRTVTEVVNIVDNTLFIHVVSSDGLRFSYPATMPSHDDNVNTVKEFEDALATARKQAYDRRVWLNKRKSLTLNEINQLLSTGN